MAKYKSVRIPVEAWENWKARQREMELALARMSNNSTLPKIPLTNIIVETSKRPLFDEMELPKLAKRRWKK